MEHGVPQGSVLDPLLWDIIGGRGGWLEGGPPPSGGGTGVHGGVHLGPESEGGAQQDMFLHDDSRRVPLETRVLVDGVHVRVGPTIKYLGLTLDSRWNFKAHLAPQLMTSGRSIRLMHQAMRPVILRAIRGVRELREEGEGLSARGLAALRFQIKARVMEQWSAIPADPSGFGLRRAEAVRPCLSEVADRRRRGLFFRLMQVLTGHGCFGWYLHRIGKEPTARCHHCPEGEDTVQHT
ncbi:uncharacterized protein LOC112588925 [Harpegnathos saltator]|uniref:uncharacterized protein LOC112588925 n=1 Tax=Harpegnathos saltator TaxID=610380 RepID=UPI000DBEEC4C|nr:uncharacterized protein LOC112588925 [Harpegnathos saltator]